MRDEPVRAHDESSIMKLTRAYFLVLTLLLGSVSTTHANSANGIVTPANLIAYLNEIDGNHVISGQFVGPGPILPINGIHASTGKWLGMIGGDYFQYDGGGIVTSFNPIAINYWNAGGLITLTLSIPNPTTGGAGHDVTRLNTAELLRPGSATHNKYVFMLNQIGDALRTLQTAGVVVILRPYHELNGDWFWWGTKFLSTAQFQSLWRFTHDYLTKTKKLHNLVWHYSVNANVGSLTARYPGDSYVDMTGFDLYSNDPSQGIASYNTLLGLGKPTSLSEFGPSTPQLGSDNFQQPMLLSALQNQMPRITFWQQWWDRNAGKPGWGMERMQNLPVALSDPRVLNRNDIRYCANAGRDRPPGCVRR
jgi:mannan endo-1,4-beta-mannosidase